MITEVRTPDWVKNAVFYQIFPDRFCRSARTQHPKHLKFKDWGSPPEAQGFQGGDLYGIIERLDYIEALGINALYLNPIFSSASNHRYHTFDYYQVDPLLGGNEALRELIDEAHARGIRIVLDGVFNHASRGFWQFHHILETGGNSPYIDWFTVHDWPLRPYPENAETQINYNAWWNLAALPKFNFNNPDVQEYFLGVAKHWIDFGIDGWRLDVAGEIEDHDFWRKFRQVVKTANPEAYIVGEEWRESEAWLQGDQWDATMNYIFMWSTISFAGAHTLRADYKRELLQLEPLDAAHYAKTLNYMLGLYHPEIAYAQLNMMDSHDTARALWIMGEDKSALKLATLLHMTLPGAPSIYYGSEVGMSGGDDPFCRAAFNWNESTWDHDLLDYYKRAIALRNAYPVLRTGRFEVVSAIGEVLIFRRVSDGVTATVVVNASDRTQSVQSVAGLGKTVWGEGPHMAPRSAWVQITAVI